MHHWLFLSSSVSPFVGAGGGGTRQAFARVLVLREALAAAVEHGRAERGNSDREGGLMVNVDAPRDALFLFLLFASSLAPGVSRPKLPAALFRPAAGAPYVNHVVEEHLLDVLADGVLGDFVEEDEVEDGVLLRAEAAAALFAPHDRLAAGTRALCVCVCVERERERSESKGAQRGALSKAAEGTVESGRERGEGGGRRAAIGVGNAVQSGGSASNRKEGGGEREIGGREGERGRETEKETETEREREKERTKRQRYTYIETVGRASDERVAALWRRHCGL